MRFNLERALVLMELGIYDRAEAELTSALGQEPDNAFIYAVLASCRSNLDKHQEAINCAKRAIVLAPDMAYAHYVLAAALVRSSQDLVALPVIDEALRLDPEDSDYWALKANIYLNRPFRYLGKKPWLDALDCADNGLRLNPKHKYCAYARAQALSGLGRTREAEATIRDALTFSPEDSLLRETQAWILLTGGNVQEARDHYREALRLDPASNTARVGLISALRAKYFFYRLLLLVMLPDGTPRWAILTMPFLFFAVLGAAGQSGNPFLKTVCLNMIVPTLGILLLIGFLIITGNSLFNLLLKIDRSDRLVLSPDESFEAGLLGICLTVIILTTALAIWGSNLLWYCSTVLTILLTLPVVAAFTFSPGKMRNGMYLYLAIDCILAIIGSITLVNTDFLESHFKSHQELIGYIIGVSIGGSILLSVYSLYANTLRTFVKAIRHVFRQNDWW